MSLTTTAMNTAEIQLLADSLEALVDEGSVELLPTLETLWYVLGQGDEPEHVVEARDVVAEQIAERDAVELMMDERLEQLEARADRCVS